MRKLIIALLILALPTGAIAGSQQIRQVLTMAKSSSSPTYIVDQGFEGTGYETGSNDGTWGTPTGSPDPDYATSPLDGDQSLILEGCTDAADTRINLSYTAGSGTTDELYFLLKINAVGGGSSGVDYLAELYGSGGAASLSTLYIQYATASTYKLAIDNANGGTEGYTTGTLSVGSTYHVWVSFTPDSGSGAYGTIAFSTDGTRPTSGNNFTSSTGGTGSAHLNYIRFFGEYTSATDCFDMILDKVKTDDATIGNNP